MGPMGVAGSVWGFVQYCSVAREIAFRTCLCVSRAVPLTYNPSMVYLNKNMLPFHFFPSDKH